MQQATLVFLLKPQNSQICIAMKKRGFGAGKWNGYGGKVNEEESVEQAALREVMEETQVNAESTGVLIAEQDLEKVGIFEFDFPYESFAGMQVHVFLTTKWENEPQESEEMVPQWFDVNEIPYQSMWADDEIWLPRVLAGEKLQGRFVFAKDGSVESYELVKLGEDYLPKIK